MSSAFRNFLIIFLLFLVIFGLVAWKVVVPYIDDELLKLNGGSVAGEVSSVVEESETSDDAIDYNRDRIVSIAYIGMAGTGHPASIFFVRIDETKGVYLTTSVPYDTNVDNSGKLAPLYSYLYMRTPEEITATVPYLVGYDVDYYAAFDYNGLYSIVEELGSISVSFDREVKVYNLLFMTEIQEYLDNDEPVPDAYCLTYGPGESAVTAEELKMLWEYEPDGKDNDYSIKDSIYSSAFLAVTKRANLGADREAFTTLMGNAFSTNLDGEAFDKYGDIMFANGYVFKGNYSKTVIYNQTYTKMIVKIRQAMGDY